MSMCVLCVCVLCLSVYACVVIARVSMHVHKDDHRFEGWHLVSFFQHFYILRQGLSLNLKGIVWTTLTSQIA